jgi:ribonuclease HII
VQGRSVTTPSPGPAPRERRWLGIDEAGRGCVLGPLVVGGFVVHERDVPKLTQIGVRDSKRLTPRRRQEVYEALGALGTRVSVTLGPTTVDRAVDRHRLNRLEAAAFAQLIRRTRPDAVFLDSCEVDTRRFGREVAGRAEFGGPVEARNHADRDVPVVGAASIVAKVRRDAALQRLEQRTGEPIGSGYPGDERTLAYLASVLGPDRPVPAGVRRSWATTQRVMAERSRTTLERFLP